ncbi:MAG: hypothetical protein K1X55_04615 [Chitinophagales bacterium]|nr:hypothetical protein [Chitinophagales bacterium]
MSRKLSPKLYNVLFMAQYVLFKISAKILNKIKIIKGLFLLVAVSDFGLDLNEFIKQEPKEN